MATVTGYHREGVSLTGWMADIVKKAPARLFVLVDALRDLRTLEAERKRRGVPTERPTERHDGVLPAEHVLGAALARDFEFQRALTGPVK